MQKDRKFRQPGRL